MTTFLGFCSILCHIAGVVLAWAMAAMAVAVAIDMVNFIVGHIWRNMRPVKVYRAEGETDQVEPDDDEIIDVPCWPVDPGQESGDSTEVRIVEGSGEAEAEDVASAPANYRIERDGKQFEVRAVPTKGRIVHFTDPIGDVWPAIIVDVARPGDPDSPVDLAVFNPAGIRYGSEIFEGEGPLTYRWPDLVLPVIRPARA